MSAVRHVGTLAAALLLAPLAGGCVETPLRQDAPMTPSSSNGAATSGIDAIVAAARADAARRFGLPLTAFELVSAEAVTWPDGSLGCPKPGMGYTQALVPGHRILLRGPSGMLDYHAGRTGVPTLCPAGRAVDPVPGGGRT